MAGTLVLTSSTQVDFGNFLPKKALKQVFNFVADASAHTVPTLSVALNGRVALVKYKPGGTTATNGTTMTWIDPDTGLDALAGTPTTITTGATAQQWYPVVASGIAIQPLVNGTYTLTIAGNSVNSAAGTVEIYTVDG